MFDFLSITQHVDYNQLPAPKGENHSYPQYNHLKHTSYLIKHKPLLFQVGQSLMPCFHHTAVIQAGSPSVKELITTN
jgi:hypothetical protein